MIPLMHVPDLGHIGSFYPVDAPTGEAYLRKRVRKNPASAVPSPHISRSTLLLFLLFVGSSLHAQEAEQPTAEARRITESPIVDGRLISSRGPSPHT